ncbi:hypothetical protein VTJ04DRAFT_10660 [Mycothermus thermophilus]|uniref:uncharacterized protein n=1 Tax=Humicola insolens TaxID=85995 RepID=UPI0037429272
MRSWGTPGCGPVVLRCPFWAGEEMPLSPTPTSEVLFSSRVPPPVISLLFASRESNPPLFSAAASPNPVLAAAQSKPKSGALTLFEVASTTTGTLPLSNLAFLLCVFPTFQLRVGEQPTARNPKARRRAVVRYINSLRVAVRPSGQQLPTQDPAGSEA